jgi:hypothetical protein
MAVPAFAINQQVMFAVNSPFYDAKTYTITRIQYIDPDTQEFTDQVTESWQYEMVEGIMNSVEAYLEAV